MKLNQLSKDAMFPTVLIRWWNQKYGNKSNKKYVVSLKEIQTQIYQSPRRWVGAWQRGKGRWKKRWDNLKVTFATYSLHTFRCGTFRAKWKTCRSLWGACRCTIWALSCLSIIFCFLRWEGHRWHRCWPSGPVDGPSGESEEDAGRISLIWPVWRSPFSIEPN